MTQNFFQRGAMWLKESLHALRLQPVSLTGIAIFSLMLSGILSSLPLVGSMLAGLWMPFGTVLTAEAARDTLEGRSPSYRSLAAAWSDPAARSGLIGIGVFSAVWMELVFLLFEFLGRSDISQWKMTEKGLDMSTVTANFPTTAVAVMAVLYIPFLMATTFAPILVRIHHQKLMKSLFFSFFGALRSIGSILTFLVLVGVLCVLLITGIELALALLGFPNGLAYIGPFVAAGISTILQAGVWVMFRDIFSGIPANDP